MTRAVADILLAVPLGLIRRGSAVAHEVHAAAAVDAGAGGAFGVSTWASAGDQTLHTVAVSVADAAGTGGARGYRWLTGNTVGADTADARARSGGVRVVDQEFRPAVAVADLPLAISSYLG
jgi:hypothetical protein